MMVRLRARWNLYESPSCSRLLIEHDLFGKPLYTFPDHALEAVATNSGTSAHFSDRVEKDMGSRP